MEYIVIEQLFQGLLSVNVCTIFNISTLFSTINSIMCWRGKWIRIGLGDYIIILFLKLPSSLD